MTISFEDLEKAIGGQGLIGLNIHYRPETESWNVWTRKRGGTTGWSTSGQFETLEQAIEAVIGPARTEADDDDWQELI